MSLTGRVEKPQHFSTARFKPSRNFLLLTPATIQPMESIATIDANGTTQLTVVVYDNSDNLNHLQTPFELKPDPNRSGHYTLEFDGLLVFISASRLRELNRTIDMTVKD